MRKFLFFVLFLSIFVYSNTTYPASSLGGMATTATSDLVKFGPLLEIVAYLSGAGLFLGGFLHLLQLSKQPGASKAPAIWMIIIGILLLGFGVMASAVSQTAFGSDEASTGLGKLGIGR